MWRVAFLLPTLFLLLTVGLDPYALYSDASDGPLRAPWWQTVLIGTDALLLVFVAFQIWRSRYREAVLFLGAELLLNLAVNFLFVVRDGFYRFVVGYGAENYLPAYLLLVALRVALLLALAVPRLQPVGLGAEASNLPGR